MILGEGAGMVLLKTVEQAQRDGDVIYAVIKAIAVNNDGRTLGPTAPSMQGQQEVMSEALRQSGLRAEDVSYVEVNGSGSEIRDLIELKAIETVYRQNGSLRCELGSMKPNIGHPLCAEGIASFIKSVLMLHKKTIVPFLSAEQPSVHYDFATSPFTFSRALTPWDSAGRALAINCFADGGTNAHVILQDPPSVVAESARRRPLAPPPLSRVDVQQFRRSAELAVEALADAPKPKQAASGGEGREAGSRFGFWGGPTSDVPLASATEPG
jgi:acyl transferase domain-containing protein